ncbi:MAG: UbiA family prenyltransferase [Acetobacteraceae bacterium]|nr:UbiA family prenyltransferase [Acetobacteraceae bacterium]
MTAQQGALLPLCVDLDGTLVRTDTLVEGLLALAGGLRFAALLGAFARGRAALKADVAALAPPDPALLPYNGKLLEYIAAQRAAGRHIVLATAANSAVAEAVAGHLGLFDEVIASTATRNLKGPAKAAALVARFGRGGFAYAGDARADLAVWAEAGAAVLVDVAPAVAARVAVPVERRIATRPALLPTLLRAMRPHQWVKNLLVFVPILTAYALTDWPGWWGGLRAFAAFSAAASGIYLVNDLLDLAADRAHPKKRLRPFAAGDASAASGLVLSMVLLALAGVLAVLAGIFVVVAAYAATSLAYSLWLKRLPLVDVFALAGLFTIRLFGGGEATGHALSLWLLAFASFLFLSLALVKRVAEAMDSGRRATSQVAGRGYGADDVMILQLFGVCASFAASLVLALYVQAEAASGRFAAPGLLWGIVPLVLLWNCRMWLSTARGYMHHDPILYAARDRVTWAIALAVVAVMLAAHAAAWPG